MAAWLKGLLLAAVVIAFLAGGAFVAWQYLGRDRARWQTPVPPFPYESSEIVVQGADGVALAGTLSVPRRPGSHAAVVLLGVAGPNDRELGFRGHKGFAVIADALARCNIASLRLDDRGVGRSGGDWREASYGVLTTDAVAAAARLRQDQRIDPRRVGLAGLSEGAAIALLGAASSPDIAFAVLMSPPGLKGEAALREQFERLVSWSLLPADTVEQYRRSFARFMILARGATDDAGRTRLSAFLGGEGASLVPSYGFVPPTIAGRVRLFSSPWYRSQLDYDPQPAMKALRVPVTVVSGTLDQVLPPAAHLPPLKAGLADKQATFVSIAGANHLLMPAWTGLPAEYARLDTTVDPRVPEHLCKWINSLHP